MNDTDLHQIITKKLKDNGWAYNRQVGAWVPGDYTLEYTPLYSSNLGFFITLFGCQGSASKRTPFKVIQNKSFETFYEQLTKCEYTPQDVLNFLQPYKSLLN